ncbi:retrotransposon gag family protein [Streptomyces plicatus]|uniref:retrotransposon gag family protein n=1 Tax=Streptomyces plicatus TaxID=1922 RepID=UPI001874D7FC|nr:retrotransposon gag family protein [Streptomyces plicatus]
MVDQQKLATETQNRLQETQNRLQEQMLKKDEDHARELANVQRQMLEVLQRRPEPVQQAPPIVINQREHDPNALFEKFRKRGPKEFYGTEDPLTADDWLAHTENIFEVFQCTGGQRVQLASSLFTGLADIWWKTVREEYRLMADGVAWDAFKRQFLEKYVPSHIKRQKAVEFQLLTQGNMTVLEYLTKFERLSRYAPELVDTVEKKIMKFLEGLNPMIERDATGVVPPVTFEEAVKRAYKFESFHLKVLRFQGKGQQQQQHQGN